MTLVDDVGHMHLDSRIAQQFWCNESLERGISKLPFQGAHSDSDVIGSKWDRSATPIFNFSERLARSWVAAAQTGACDRPALLRVFKFWPRIPRSGNGPAAGDWCNPSPCGTLDAGYRDPGCRLRDVDRPSRLFSGAARLGAAFRRIALREPGDDWARSLVHRRTPVRPKKVRSQSRHATLPVTR